MEGILKKLSGGDLRSIGRSNEVVKEVIRDSSLMAEVIEGMLNTDPVVRLRSADVAEKVGRRHPEYLQPLKSRLIREIVKVSQPEVRWHLAQIFTLLTLSASERRIVTTTLCSWLDDPAQSSKIVRVMALQALADLAFEDKKLRQTALDRINRALNEGSPSEKARCRKLLSSLQKTASNRTAKVIYR